MERDMSVSDAYLEFRRHLTVLQSKARVTDLVSGTVSRARNLPECAELDVPALVERVARHKGIEVRPEEVLQASQLVAQELHLEHH
jgi:hypothetical protein